MNENLIDKYRAYATTEEAFAVLFVKKYLLKAAGHWVDITDYERYERSKDKLHFRHVYGGLYRRKIKPKYPSKSQFTINGKFNEANYILMARAITWETAHRDIAQQQQKNVLPINFKIAGVSYNKNKGFKNGFFRDDAPPAVKALEKDLHSTANLCSIAKSYLKKPEFVYEIKSINLYRRKTSKIF